MNLRTWLLAILCGYSFSSFASSNTEITPFIVGGNDATQNYPWMAQVFVGSQRCGGVLIGESWVLTAAHCTYDVNADEKHLAPSQVKVVLGVYEMVNSSHAGAVAVSEVYQHPNYVSPSSSGAAFDYDVSLLRLATPQIITPPLINASQVTDALNSGGFMSVIGFGRVNSDPSNPEYPEVLQQGNLSLYDTSSCASRWTNSTITERMFCAYGTDQDACSGDSGGPVFVREGSDYRLLGLVSWGSIGCQNRPGVYADVGKVCTWVTDTASLAGDNSLQCNQTQPAISSGGGTSFWLLLMVFPLALIRYRFPRHLLLR
ncbi:serine protease [Agarivorans sp. 1_MG-2023]|uniref:S1 family serine peptidase n=1 Tax=Agarivorans sp. 1_MG-2023 TaxID=3062634 RepID=UPI0026E37F18|nr:serine protease [Agarivorans sp. 1_MG-2023]MDO6765087.1 serine protease [Agarivorans sp. 1_MG-2023]